MIRVLVVDDSALIRRIISKILADEDDVEVAATACNGMLALEQLERAAPDLVTLDVDMPVMNGLETIVALRKRGFSGPIVMLSSRTGCGAEATMRALSLGATDFIEKPAGMANMRVAMAEIRQELIGKIKALCPPQPQLSPEPLAARRRVAPSRAEVVAVASSTGGPTALGELLARISERISVPIVVVQHMPPLFTARLAKTLSRKCGLDVREAADGDRPEAGVVLIAPGDHHVEIRGTPDLPRVALHNGPPENSCRPAADPLFRSVASCYGDRSLAVVLTGMGRDGCAGARAIREAGGQVVVQNRESSVVWGMPGFVAEAGLADAILPLEGIANRIVAAAPAITTRSRSIRR